MNTNNVKGFSDFTGADALKRDKIRQIIKRAFELYGFEPAETPIIELEEFVKGDNPRDDAVRDIFKLKDRGKRELALRYEFTFQLKRIARNQKLPFKRYQIGPVFRDEPIREGRMRQFVQCDADIVGSSLKDEAELLSMTQKIFDELGVKISMYINNRKLINEILVSENIREQDREQVIRELDKLDKLSRKEVADNLKKYNAEKLLDIFLGDPKSFEKYSFYSEVKELTKLCKLYGVTVLFRPFLARGFSYYNSGVFEVWSKDLNVSICGGGSYIFNDIQSSGISFGLEPLFLLAPVSGKGVQVQVISLDEDMTAISLASKLRDTGISTLLITDKTIGKAMEYANARGVESVVFVGKEEVKKKKFTLKDMKTGKEEKLSEKDLVKRLSLS